MIEDKIIKGCNLRQKNLLRAAKLASKKPDTGVKILKKGAYYVIKDCADITQKYLALMAYGAYEDPIKELKGKFTENEIIDFVSRSSKNNNVNQLLNVIFADISAQERGTFSNIEESSADAEIDFDDINEDDDIYGDYEYVEGDDSDDEVQVPVNINIDMSDGTAVIEKLIEVFEVKR